VVGAPATVASLPVGLGFHFVAALQNSDGTNANNFGGNSDDTLNVVVWA